MTPLYTTFKIGAHSSNPFKEAKGKCWGSRGYPLDRSTSWCARASSNKAASLWFAGPALARQPHSCTTVNKPQSQSWDCRRICLRDFRRLGGPSALQQLTTAGSKSQVRTQAANPHLHGQGYDSRQFQPTMPEINHLHPSALLPFPSGLPVPDVGAGLKPERQRCTTTNA